VTYPGSPRLFKGALVVLNKSNQIATAIPFMYNPNTVNRTLEAQMIESKGESGAPTRFSGAPVEIIKLEIKLDAIDGLEKGDKNAVASGIYPQLAALEILLYPDSATVKLNARLALAGTIEIIPATAPMILLIWGVKRIVPVRITEYSVVEEYHDPNLNPIVATISLGLRVLSYSDLSANTTGWNVFMSHQVVKESFAQIAASNTDKSTYQSLL
jgi:hypothetical protein